MIDLAYAFALFLIFLRLGTYIALVPVFFPNGTPNILKVGLSFIIGYIIIPGVDYSTLGSVLSNYTIISYSINEVMTGILLALTTTLCFNVIKMAGALLDMQIGLSMLSMFDPNSKSTSTLIDRMMYWIAIMVFLITDTHHVLLKTLMESFNIVPLGQSIIFDGTIMTFVEAFTQYFILGLKIAVPIILIILITELTMGLVARTVPQINVMILGLPIKLAVGLLTIVLALPLIVNSMEYIFNQLPNVFKNIYKVLPFIIIFADEKTEEATPKKKSDAKKKGQVAKSKEVSLALTLVACTLIFAVLTPYLGGELKKALYYFFGGLNQGEFTYEMLQKNTIDIVLSFMKIYLPVALPVMVVGVFANFIQSGFLLTGEAMKPKLSKLNPINGFKRMFSVRSLVELLKDTLIIIVVGYIGFGFIKENYQKILNMGISVHINAFLPAFMELVVDIFFRITLIMVVIALSDYIYQRRMYNKELKMTKQEIKEEFKQSEGDPQVKGKIKQKQREIATRRMMQAVPNATVVVTNPTHLAIALAYEDGNMGAPKVVAKGSDRIALKIKEIAKENNVPIIENKPLARLIYEKVDLNREIPEDMYQAVAEILALVYKMKNKKRS